MMNTEIEALWVKLRPSRLPRGTSCIILCNLYHPPSGNDQQAINYLHHGHSRHGLETRTTSKRL